MIDTNLMLELMAGPGLILTSPSRRSIMANLQVGLEQGIGGNLRLKQRYGKQCQKESELCTLMRWQYILA